MLANVGQMIMTYFNLILSLMVIIIENGIYLQLISLMLFNLSVYTLIAKNSYRNVASYFVFSSISLLVIILGYFINPIYNNIYLTVLLIAILIKLNSYPFTSWIIPIYRNLRINVSILIIISTKIIYLVLLSRLNADFNYLYILIGILLLGTITSIRSNNIIELLIYSGSMQICFLFIPVYLSNLNLYIIYTIFYLLSIYALYLNISNNLSILLRFVLLSINFYMLIGIPPFIGFFYKLFILFNLFINCDTYYNLYLILAFILSSIYISYVYFNYLHRTYTTTEFSFNKISALSLYSTISFILFSLFYTDIII